MPINTDEKKVIHAVITIEDYRRILEAVDSIKKSGRKTTVSKYVGCVIIQHLETENLFRPETAITSDIRQGQRQQPASE